MFPDLDGDAFKIAVRSVERAINRLSEPKSNDLLVSLKDVGSFGKRVLPDDDSSFIWGPVGAGVTDDPVDDLQKLYARFVAQYDEQPQYHRDDAAIWKPVREKLAERNLASRLQSKTITSEIDRVEFEHAWKNGAWHCYQPLSFDLTTDENIREKAARWTGHMMALSKGREAFKPHFLVGMPSDEQLRGAYQSAIKILKMSPIESQIFEESKIDDLVDQIESEMRAHDAGNSERTGADD